MNVDSTLLKGQEREWRAAEDKGRNCVDTSDEEDEASGELLRRLQEEDERPVGEIRPLTVEEKREAISDANKASLEGARRLGRLVGR